MCPTRRCAGGGATVVSHVCLHQVTGSEGTAKRQLSSQDTSSNDLRKLACVVARLAHVSATDTKKVKHGGLWLEDGTTTDRTDFNAGHGDGDLKIAVQARECQCIFQTDRCESLLTSS